MIFSGTSYLAIVVAAVAGFAFGSVWYMALSKQWMAAVGLTEPPKPAPMPFIAAFVCQLIMAWMLAGLVGHMGEVTVIDSMLTGALVWFGFVLTTMVVNHRFQSAPWSLTVIDSGHWLGVLLVIGLVIGLFGVQPV